MQAYVRRMTSSLPTLRILMFRQQLDSMSEDQLTRFEFFVRSHLPRARVKDIITNALGGKHNITDEMAIVVCGLAKLFVGEITEIGETYRCLLSFVQ